MKKPSSKIREEIARLQEQLKAAETREAERIGRIALKAGLGDIEIEEDALLAALKAGQVAGAGLDVFMEEPLPADSPFWDLPNVIITPHLSAISPVYLDRALKLFSDNLACYLSGAPLLTPIDKARGY